MQKFAVLAVLVSLLFLDSCSDLSHDLEAPKNRHLAKNIFNSEWEKQGVGTEEWYYSQTVIDAPPNTEALGIAEGTWLHPEKIRWEITRDLLIGWRAHASAINADHEENAGVARHYRGAPIVAFAITSHFDVNFNEQNHEEIIEANADKPWHLRKFITVDWSRNLVAMVRRQDGVDDAPSMNNQVTHLVDDGKISNAKRSRFHDTYFDFVTRHPVSVSSAAMWGEYGDVYRDDTAAPVIDIRHSFKKRVDSDFAPRYYPDNVVELDADGKPGFDAKGNLKQIAINDRFGFFRTSYSGRPKYDAATGTLGGGSVVNATIFNIWERSHDDQGNLIPIQHRVPKPIIYYTNLLHPRDLLATSLNVAQAWNHAFRNMVYYAQPNKYRSLQDVPPMWILRENSCNLENVTDWLHEKRADLKVAAETSAHTDLSSISRRLDQASNPSESMNFSERSLLEISAKRSLEQICSALEYLTANSEEKFEFQRPGDLRFNMLNLVVDNITTQWSGYGPMLSDPITGETISATANINLKYIDIQAQQMAKQISLLTSKNPGLHAVFGGGEVRAMTSDTRSNALATMHRRMSEIEREGTSIARTALPSASAELGKGMKLGMSNADMKGIEAVEAALLRSVNAKDDSRLSNAPHAYENGVKSTQRASINAVMDPIGFVDDISIGIALRFSDLSEHERFIKIRELIYEAVALHEIGHNVGLRHNMESSSDSLNYGEAYWWIDQLPKDLKAAKDIVKDGATIEQLQQCMDDQARIDRGLHSIYGDNKITTQDCLLQKNGMYASIMDYHASSLADIKGLGKYDQAAIKFAYGQLLEVFPKRNLNLNADSINLARWLKLNDHRHIPKVMLKNTRAINDREHVVVNWSEDGIARAFPTNALPYAYCDDPSGRQGPRCLAYDFGPDMTSSAQWLKTRYWQQFLLTHFAKDSSWGNRSKHVKSAMRDIDILKRYTNMMRWYHRYYRDDPEFRGSYAEQDYLKALAIGLNHFAHVIGLPQSGAHVSAPTWAVEDQNSLSSNANRLAASNFMVPFSDLSDCSIKSVTSVNSNGNVNGRFDYQFVDVPLGVGRPLFPGIVSDLEDEFVLYSGSQLVKKYALYMLSAPLFLGPSSDSVERSDLLNMTWYRMFPDAVGHIYSAVISNNFEALGPIVAKDGSITPRDVINESTLKVIPTTNAEPALMPALDSSFPILAAQTAITFIGNTINQESNLVKSIKISCRGCSDDLEYDESEPGHRVVRFVNLSGHEYKAPKFNDRVSIGADLLEKANRQKDRYLQLKQCIQSEEARRNDPFCQCVKVMDRITFDNWMCCEEGNPECSGPTLSPVGDGVCTMAELEKRLELSRDQLDSMVGFIDGLRKFLKQADG